MYLKTTEIFHAGCILNLERLDKSRDTTSQFEKNKYKWNNYLNGSLTDHKK